MKNFNQFIKESIADPMSEAEKIHDDFFSGKVLDEDWAASEASGDTGMYWADRISSEYDYNYRQDEWTAILDYIYELLDQ